MTYTTPIYIGTIITCYMAVFPRPVVTTITYSSIGTVSMIRSCWPVACQGHGTCNSVTGECECDLYWTGSACEKADCAGTPDCNGVNATCGIH
jgi:hypothetical protein